MRRISEQYHGLFLNYRNDSEYLGDNDHEFSLLAISECFYPMSTCEVVVPEDKFEYLKAEKTGTMHNLGLLNQGQADLKAIIDAKISKAHLYNLNFSPEHNVSKFSIIVESKTQGSSKFKTTIALKYLPDTQQIQIITLY